MPDVVPQLLTGILILGIFLVAFRSIEGTWFPPGLLFVFGFFSSTFLYCYSLTLVPVFFPTVGYENFGEALFLAQISFCGLLAGYILYGLVLGHSRLAAPMPLRYTSFTSVQGAHILGVVIVLCALFIIYYTVASGALTTVRGENSYLTDEDVGIFNRIGFIVGYAAPPLLLALYISAQSFDVAARKVILSYVWLAAGLLILLTVVSLNRQLAVTLILYMMLVYHYRIRALRKSTMFALLAILVVVQVMRTLRTLDLPVSELSLGEIVAFVAETLNWDNMVLIVTAVFTGIAGWDVFTNVLSIIPAREGYHYGATYISSFLGLTMPRSLGLGSYNDVTPSVWYVNAYAPGTTNNGFDFSMLAEAYMNFGYFMPLVFILVGVLVAHLSRTIRTTNSAAGLFCSVIILVALTFSLRSDSNVLFKSIFYYTVPALFLILLVNSWLAVTRTGGVSSKPSP